MSTEIFTLLPDAPVPRRMMSAYPNLREMECDATRLEGKAEDLRMEAMECEDRARRLREQVAKLKKVGFTSSALADFIGEALACTRLDWFETEMLRQAAELQEWDNGELIHLGLLHALPVPHELFPPMQKARAA